MPSLIRFAKPSSAPAPRPRNLGDLLQEVAQKAPDQIDHIRAIVEWILDQLRQNPKAS